MRESIARHERQLRHCLTRWVSEVHEIEPVQVIDYGGRFLGLGRSDDKLGQHPRIIVPLDTPRSA